MLRAEITRPQRTPEEMADKQTQMMVRDLNLQDSMQIDTLYRMHLKYAKRHMLCQTRQELLDCLIQAVDELKGILSKEQYKQFMNQQDQTGPRHPQCGPGQGAISTSPRQGHFHGQIQASPNAQPTDAPAGTSTKP